MSAAAYDYCRQIARDSGSSFYTGMRLLRPERREALFAVYALARRIDDVADGPLPAAEKLARLDAIRGELARIGESDDPVLVAVADASARFPVPLGAFGELVDGAEMDVRGTEYATFAELVVYCRRVAGSIGRLALGMFDVSDRNGAAARRRARRGAPDREHPARPQRGPSRRARVPAAPRISSGSAARFAARGSRARPICSSRSRPSAGSGSSTAASGSCRCSTAAAQRASSPWRAPTGGCSNAWRQTRRSPSEHRPSLRAWEKGWVLARSLARAA